MNKFNPNYTVPSGATLREVIDFVGYSPVLYIIGFDFDYSAYQHE